MALQFIIRIYNPTELRLLTTLKKRLEKESATKVKFYHFIIAAILGAGFAWTAASIPVLLPYILFFNFN